MGINAISRRGGDVEVRGAPGGSSPAFVPSLDSAPALLRDDVPMMVLRRVRDVGASSVGMWDGEMCCTASLGGLMQRRVRSPQLHRSGVVGDEFGRSGMR